LFGITVLDAELADADGFPSVTWSSSIATRDNAGRDGKLSFWKGRYELQHFRID